MARRDDGRRAAGVGPGCSCWAGSPAARPDLRRRVVGAGTGRGQPRRRGAEIRRRPRDEGPPRRAPRRARSGAAAADRRRPTKLTFYQTLTGRSTRRRRAQGREAPRPPSQAAARPRRADADAAHARGHAGQRPEPAARRRRPRRGRRRADGRVGGPGRRLQDDAPPGTPAEQLAAAGLEAYVAQAAAAGRSAAFRVRVGTYGSSTAARRRAERTARLAASGALADAHVHGAPALTAARAASSSPGTSSAPASRELGRSHRPRLRGPERRCWSASSRARWCSSPTSSAPPRCRRDRLHGRRPTARAPGPPARCASPPTCRVSIEGRDVIIVEDIIDTGRTIDLPARNLAPGIRGASRSARCWTRCRAARSTSPSTTWASSSPTSSWWATASTTTAATAACPMSPSWRRPDEPDRAAPAPRVDASPRGRIGIPV